MQTTSYNLTVSVQSTGCARFAGIASTCVTCEKICKLSWFQWWAMISEGSSAVATIPDLKPHAAAFPCFFDLGELLAIL